MESQVDVPFWIGDKEFTEADIELFRITVQRFSRFSCEEIILSICENLSRESPNGRPKKGACRNLLFELEQKGVLTSPLRSIKSGRNHSEQRGSAFQTQLCASLKDVPPVTVEPVKQEE